jgi:glycosyltransferase involved in cell wall biosynthesis
MPAYYRAADCVLLPSHGEGLPLVVQEAMASGVACVISADEPYAGPLIAAGACLGAPREPSLMAQAVDRALANSEGAIGPAAHAHALEHWGVDTMVARHIAIFEKLLTSGSSRPAHPGSP